MDPKDELDTVEGALDLAIQLGGYLQDSEGSVPKATASLRDCVAALLMRKADLRGQIGKGDNASIAAKGAHDLYR